MQTRISLMLKQNGSGILESLVPRFCVLCGQPAPLWRGDRGFHAKTDDGAPSVVCQTCTIRLVPISGLRCTRCGRPLVSENGECMDCRSKEWAFDRILPVYLYRTEIATLITEFKIHGHYSLASFFGSKLYESIATLNSDLANISIVPIPPRPEKRGIRETDQVELLVRELRRYGMPILHLLSRKKSLQQKKLGKLERKKNSGLAYSLLENKIVPSHVILVDDVSTTGATLDACARLLRAAGASRIDAVVIAVD